LLPRPAQRPLGAKAQACDYILLNLTCFDSAHGIDANFFQRQM
jgi:hypothetical protein